VRGGSVQWCSPPSPQTLQTSLPSSTVVSEDLVWCSNCLLRNIAIRASPVLANTPDSETCRHFSEYANKTLSSLLRQNTPKLCIWKITILNLYWRLDKPSCRSSGFSLVNNKFRIIIFVNNQLDAQFFFLILILIKIQLDATVGSLVYFTAKSLYMFRLPTAPIIRSTKNVPADSGYTF